jgi:hypothetical protein
MRKAEGGKEGGEREGAGAVLLKHIKTEKAQALYGTANLGSLVLLFIGPAVIPATVRTQRYATYNAPAIAFLTRIDRR